LVVSEDRLASEAGANVLKRGGNAVDAAITAAHVIGVSAPAFSGPGGGGFALIWLAREEKAVFVDYRERAPSAASEDMFRLTRSGKVFRNANAVGYRAVAVPGAILGHALILERYGTLRLGETLAPAARVARRGFRVGRALAYIWKLGAKKLLSFDESRLTFLRKGRPYGESDQVALPALGKTLTTLAREGAEEFYRGSLAGRISEHLTTNGGLVSTRDLEEYEPKVREPLCGSYGGYEIISAPPPSSGGAVILQSLNILETFPLKSYGIGSAEGLHILAEALARSSLNCCTTISDPAFSNPPTERLVSKAFAREVASTISPNTSTPNFPSNPASASNTTHLVVIDGARNVVSLTESLECYFGSGVTVPGTGLLLNDTMHDFDPHPGMTNSVGPRKIPMSNMSPTIVLKEGKPILALGSAGGPRIVSSTLQVLLNVIEYGMELRDAVAAPRIHVNGTSVELEETVQRAVAMKLRKMGHSVEVRKRAGKADTGLYFGGVHAAQISDDNSLSGAPDPRRDGLAIGLS
jgi:gamma-glutamyltranspeptidase/glutathione hydrolase